MAKTCWRKLMFSTLFCAAFGLHASLAYADSFTFSGVTTGGNTVNGTAVLTASAGSNVVTITLTNNILNIQTVGQGISGLTFQVFNSAGNAIAISPVTITQQSGRTIDFPGCVGPCDTVAEKTGVDIGANGSGVDPLNWGLTTNDPAYLNALGFTGGGNPADELILGAPTSGLTYASANGSILNTSSHLPFVVQTATFTVTLGTNLPTDFRFGNVDMYFGTAADTLVSTPEPGSLVLLGTGLAALGFFRFKTRSKKS